MGMTQPLDFTAGWTMAVDTLDSAFPLAKGSHADVADYVVMQGSLLAISADGRCTGLADASQFIEAEGDEQAPDAILLGNGQMQAEIEPTRTASTACGQRAHRLQLMAMFGEAAVAA